MGRRDKARGDIDAPVGRDFRLFLAVLWLVFRSLKLLGAEPLPVDIGAASQEVRAVPAVRAATPPVIDGILDDECWGRAPAVTDFTCHESEKPAKEQTFVRVLYDDAALYVSFECIEPEPEKIQAMERKYDRDVWGDDWIELQVDTFHDHRTKYIFVANPLGTRLDIRDGLFGWDPSWDYDWRCACTIQEDRWIAEMAIPIGGLHFLRGDNVTWGINFHRCDKGNDQTSTWCYRNRKPWSVREFGHLVGLDLSRVAIDRRPRFSTYVSGTVRERGGEDEASTGLDASLRLNPQLISAFTINPDYGQVEADPDTIELRDTERYLQERRPFFVEGGEIFHTPINIYYSRRFVEIDAGAKVTGIDPDWSLGLLDVQGEITRDDVLRDGNYLVGRFARNIGDESHIGAMFTNSERQDGANRVGSLDSRIFLTRDVSWTTQVLGLYDEVGIETDGEIDEDAYAVYSGVFGGKEPFWWGIDFNDISRGFRPDLGYVPRRDIRGPAIHLEYWQDFDEGPVKWYGGDIHYHYYEDHDGKMKLRDITEYFNIGFRNEFEFSLYAGDAYHRPYQNYWRGVWVGYYMKDFWRSISGCYTRGEFEEVPYDEFKILKPFRIGDRLTTAPEGTYRIEKPDEGRKEIWLWRWVTEYTFTWEGRVKFTAEQSSEDRHNLTLLFEWPIRENLDLYLVLNDWKTDEDEERAAFAKVVYHF